MEAGAEEALIDRCRKQDVEAFGKFVDAYQARVFGFVKRMVSNADEAADVTQEVFIRAYQSFARFDGRSSVRTWLFRIANNLCIDRSRQLGRTPNSVGLVSDFEDGEEMDFSDSRWQPEALMLDAELIQVVEAGAVAGKRDVVEHEDLLVAALIDDLRQFDFDSRSGLHGGRRARCCR
jgi:RNA polymerase sigma-70 factor (ECF subfamily)